MTKLFLSILFFSPFLSVMSQVKRDNPFCDYTFKVPTRFKVFYPCAWEVTDGQRDNVKKIFVNTEGTQGLSVMCLPVQKGYKIEMKKIKSDWVLMGEIVSAKETQIESLQAFELIVESKIEKPVGNIYSKVLTYSFVFNNNLFGITYSCQGLNKKNVNKSFAEDLIQYKVLASRTILLDKNQ